jgi:methionyl-tRNA formyltransferase
MRLIFMGTPDFALPSLERLVDSGHRVLAVVTRPDRPRGRGRKRSPPPVKELAASRGLPVLQPENLKDPQFIRQLSGYRADLFVVVAFRILPREVVEMPPRGTIDVHPSMLPRYRGAAPIQWAIINGESQTGVSVFFIGGKIDAGDIIRQRAVKIESDETAGELSKRLSRVSAEVLLEVVDEMDRGRVETTSQDGAEPSPAPKISRQHGRIHWDRPAEELRNLIRGLSPSPGAYTSLAGKTIKIYHADPAGPSPRGASPGEITTADGRAGLVVNTADGQLSLTEIQLEGKRRMTSAEFLRGFRLQAGDRFEV